MGGSELNRLIGNCKFEVAAKYVKSHPSQAGMNNINIAIIDMSYIVIIRWP